MKAKVRMTMKNWKKQIKQNKPPPNKKNKNLKMKKEIIDNINK